jgi:hypothetical protein
MNCDISRLSPKNVTAVRAGRRTRVVHSRRVPLIVIRCGKPSMHDGSPLEEMDAFRRFLRDISEPQSR